MLSLLYYVSIPSFLPLWKERLFDTNNTQGFYYNLKVLFFFMLADSTPEWLSIGMIAISGFLFCTHLVKQFWESPFS